MAMLDEKKQFEDIKKAATNAISSLFPVEQNKHRLVLNSIWVEDNLDNLNYKKQAETKNKRGTWGAKVLADLTLVDKKTGKTVDREKKVRLMVLPKMTDRFSYIVKGNEYQVTNQLRLKPGAYVKQAKTGGVKTQINLARGRNVEIHVGEKGIVRMVIGGAKIPLYPLLIGMGISRQQVEKAWGRDLANQNASIGTTSEAAVKRLASALFKSKTQSVETARDELKEYIKTRTEISPEMTKLTLGQEFKDFSPSLWLSASEKLVKVVRGDEEPDDVDSLAFKEFFSEEDSIKERILGNQKSLIGKIKRNLDSRDRISEIVNLNTLGKVIESFYTNDERSNVSEQINPLHMYSGRERVTFMGPGGVTDTQKVTDEMRNVHPSHLSFIDPVHTPESDKIGLNLGLTIGTKKKGRDLASTLYDVKNKKMVSLTPIELFDKSIAFPDEWDHKTKQFKNKTIKAQLRGKIVNISADKVDYVVTNPQNAFTLSSNLIPYIDSDNGNRSMMAGKHMEQAIALKYRDEPLVQNRIGDTDKTFEAALGESLVSNQRAPVSGKVVAIDGDSITVQSGRKKHTVGLYNNFALNQKTHLHHDPVVKVGDTVEKGQLLAENNYTKNGVMALGKNLRVGYIPYKGYNFEDGIVITDTAAKKLTSEHLVKIESEIGPDTVMSLPKFKAQFPNEINANNQKLLDSSGVITKGSRVNMGDVVIAHLKTSLGDSTESIKAQFHKSLRPKFQQKIETWNYQFPGEVVDVIKTKDRVIVHIRSDQPAVIGDKLAGRHGNKGIITKIIPDEHAPKNNEGDPVEILLNPHGVVSRINIGQIYESAAGKVARKKGETKKVQNFKNKNNLDVIKQELKAAGVSDQEELFDPMTNKSLGKVHVGNPYILKLNKQSETNISGGSCY
jgi:DNA-directed RNA polymerase subunit beta